MALRLATALTCALLLPSLWIQGPAFAQQSTPAQSKDDAPAAGWHRGMGGWGMMDHGGMMGGWGPGMMGWGGAGLKLGSEQRNKLQAIRKDLRDKQFALMDQMHDSMHSANFYRGGTFDEQAARRAFEAAEKVHRQMFENMLDAHKRMDAVLTPQQRQQLSQGRQ